MALTELPSPVAVPLFHTLEITIVVVVRTYVACLRNEQAGYEKRPDMKRLIVSEHFSLSSLDRLFFYSEKNSHILPPDQIFKPDISETSKK